MPFEFSEGKENFAYLSDPSLQEKLEKWGVVYPGDNVRWGMRQYQYSYLTSNSYSSGSAEHDVFHHELAGEFLTDFFRAATADGRESGERKGIAIPQGLYDTVAERYGKKNKTVEFSTVAHNVLDFEALVECLVTNGIVRRVNSKKEENGPQESENRENKELLSLPVVRRSEVMLPGNSAVISDELRALFLRLPPSIVSHEREEGSAEEREEEDEEEELDYDYWSSPSDRPRSRTALRATWRHHRPYLPHSFLYHTLWRLIAGGGLLNQYEEDLLEYLYVLRALFREWFTSALTVRRVERKKKEEGNESEIQWEPSCESNVRIYSIRLLDPLRQGQENFSQHFRYCYVMVIRKEQRCILWYHSGE